MIRRRSWGYFYISCKRTLKRNKQGHVKKKAERSPYSRARIIPMGIKKHIPKPGSDVNTPQTTESGEWRPRVTPVHARHTHTPRTCAWCASPRVPPTWRFWFPWKERVHRARWPVTESFPVSPFAWC